MSNERIERLEERLAWLQRHVEEQDRAMLELGDRLARIQKQMTTLRERLPAPAEPGGAGEEERPPHY